MAATALARTDQILTAWAVEPRQAAFISCPVFEIFFGGARGGGKTDAVLGDFLEHADSYGEHAIGLMIRRTRVELVETIERSKVIYTRLGWVFHEQDKMWRAPNGARLRFAYAGWQEIQTREFLSEHPYRPGMPYLEATASA